MEKIEINTNLACSKTKFHGLLTDCRMTKNIKILILLIGCSMACISCSHDKKIEQSTPNIIYFLADDLGYGELGAVSYTHLTLPTTPYV